MFEKLISRLFKRNNTQENNKTTITNDVPGVAKNAIRSSSVVSPISASTMSKSGKVSSAPQVGSEPDAQDIPLPTKTVNVSVASLNRVDFLFYDYLLGSSQTSTTLNPIEQYILIRVNQALKAPESVLTHFPVLPQTVITLSNLLNDPNFDLQAFINVVEKEPSIATELMKKANSPFYKRGDNEVINLQQAFMFMGANDIKEFVLNRFVKNLCQQKPIYFKTFGEKIWLHSQDVATVAKDLAKQRKQNADAAYTIGLMHDLGKVVIFQFMVEAFKTINPDFKQDSLVFKKFLSEKSMRLSVELMKIWSMPSLIINVVQAQTEVINTLDTLEPLAAILYEANLISEISLTYKAGNLQADELEILLTDTKLREDAKQYLRQSLNIDDEGTPFT